jgi:hypothetical protein
MAFTQLSDFIGSTGRGTMCDGFSSPHKHNCGRRRPRISRVYVFFATEWSRNVVSGGRGVSSLWERD